VEGRVANSTHFSRSSGSVTERWRYSAGAIAALILWAAALQAQRSPAASSAPFDPLRQPGQTLMCRYVPPPEGAPMGTVALQFNDGELLNHPIAGGTAIAPDRQIDAVYDSTGGPLTLRIVAREKRDTVEFGHGIVVTYPTPQSEQGIEVVIPIGVPRKGDPEHRDLSAEELKRVRWLSGWLWNHRCQRIASP